ncbi:type II toxin-antitoxin system VapC family toxin [Rhizobium sp. CG5]|uniref:type II toxin-antitoxin system VapC family toxin n=1 Tax=Rhizobium sp. CG5 TaxID=2726076 RepID=UPI0020334F3E|nr:type II toxin-antitoxin system VapC family toxin [Rhizobium sp. CG5]MCM2475887.1 type II toxin-antitoxin system VapC family toxin [Rhizobium sp. CG5]
MIVIDTSALIAIVTNESAAAACQAILEKSDTQIFISAATLTETLIVAGRKGCLPGLTKLIERFPFTSIDVTEEFASRAASAYARWGKGIHPASLNFGDCFAYALAEMLACPLLYVGDDFARTDVIYALTA